MSVKKRKIDSECGVFQHKWINQNFVIANKGKDPCLPWVNFCVERIQHLMALYY